MGVPGADADMYHGHWRPLRNISHAICPTCVEYEESFRSEPLFEYTQEHTEIPIFVCGLYLMMIFWLPEHLGTVPGQKILRKVWGLWNVALSLFSIFGASRTVPVLVHHLFVRPMTNTGGGFIFTVCGGVYNGKQGSEYFTTGPTGLWVGLFIYSKLPELLDTAFLVIQKKPVIFLHWFHHVTVLLYCWHAYHHQVSSGLWFATMNYCVHSIMYAYYAIMIFPTPKPIKKAASTIAPLITTVQILQMIGGIVVTVTGAYQTVYHPESCNINAANYKLGLAMYFSYCVLFMTLFYDKFLKPKPTSGGSAVKAKDAVAKTREAICGPELSADVSADAAGFFHGRLVCSTARRARTHAPLPVSICCSRLNWVPFDVGCRLVGTIAATVELC